MKRGISRILNVAFLFLLTIMIFFMIWVVESIRINIIIPYMRSVLGDHELIDLLDDPIVSSPLIPLLIGIFIILVIALLIAIAIVTIRYEEERVFDWRDVRYYNLYY